MPAVNDLYNLDVADSPLIVGGSYSNSVWLSPAEIAALPATGTAFTRMQNVANQTWGTPDLDNNDNPHDVQTLAGALFAARTGSAPILAKTQAALASLTSLTSTSVLPLARSLQAYIIAADLIGYRDPAFIAWVTNIIDANIPGHSTANSLRQTAQRSANNWGGHSRASLAAAAVYLEDASMLADAVQAQQEFIGTYAGGSPQMIFSTTSPDQDWHFDLGNKAGVNRLNAGFLSGVLPEEWRRDTGFDATSATQLSDLNGVTSIYLWEGIQGFITAAVILHRQGSVPIASGGGAVQRAIEVLLNTAHPVAGDDRWMPWLANRVLGTNYDTSAGIQEGKGMGYNDWTGVSGTGVGGTNATRINAIFAGRTPPNISNHTQYYPADPVTAQEITVTSAAMFNAYAGQSPTTGTANGWLITIGNSFSGNIQISASDIDVVMDNSLTISGSLGISLGGSAPYRSRIRWTGGNIGNIYTARAHDVLFDNVYATATTAFALESNNPENYFGYGNPADRVAVINSTLEVIDPSPGSAGQWALHAWMAPSIGSVDHGEGFIVANVKVMSDHQNNRFISTDNLMIVDSVFNPDGRSGNGMRIHDAATHVWIRDSWSKGSMLTTVTESGTGIQLTDAYFDNYDRYDLNMFAADSRNTGTVVNSTLYGGTFNSSPLTNGGGNASAADQAVPDYSGVGAIR